MGSTVDYGVEHAGRVGVAHGPGVCARWQRGGKGVDNGPLRGRRSTWTMLRSSRGNALIDLVDVCTGEFEGQLGGLDVEGLTTSA